MSKTDDDIADLLDAPYSLNRLPVCSKSSERPLHLDKGLSRRIALTQEWWNKALAEPSWFVEPDLVKVGYRHGSWHRIWTSVWKRLMTSCRIASELADAALQTAIMEHIETQLATIDSRSGEVAEITELLDLLTKCAWCDKEIVERWNEKLFQSLIAMKDDLEEGLVGLAAAANWFVRESATVQRRHRQTRLSKTFPRTSHVKLRITALG